MVERLPGAGGSRLGLDRDQLRRRQRADGVPDSGPRREFVLGGRRIRNASGNRIVFKRDEVRFETLRRWRSPRTNIDYPIAMRVVAPTFDVVLEPLFDDQEETHARAWDDLLEGAVRVRRGRTRRTRYLELTGYGEPLRL
jgi:predicted secreted hydrolase